MRAKSQLRDKKKPDVCRVPAEGRGQASCEQTDICGLRACYLCANGKHVVCQELVQEFYAESLWRVRSELPVCTKPFESQEQAMFAPKSVEGQEQASCVPSAG